MDLPWWAVVLEVARPTVGDDLCGSTVARAAVQERRLKSGRREVERRDARERPNE